MLKDSDCMHQFFRKNLNELDEKFGLDGIEDIILNRADKLYFFADVSKKPVILKTLSGDLTKLDLDYTDEVPLKTFFETMELDDNSYAEIGGKEAYYNNVKQTVLEFNTETNITFPIKPKGKKVWLRMVVNPVSKNKKICSFHITDVTKYIAYEEDLFYKTHRDSLTNLYNKYTLDYHYGLRYENDPFHVFYLDLDDFKEINDLYGHRVGNKYLRQVAKILQQFCHDDSQFYRIGGDEFVGLFFDDEETVKTIADKIIKQTRALNETDEDTQLSVSIGLIKGTQREDLVRKADELMYEAKDLGKNRYLYKIEK